jgi:hypothetical protein
LFTTDAQPEASDIALVNNPAVTMASASSAIGDTKCATPEKPDRKAEPLRPNLITMLARSQKREIWRRTPCGCAALAVLSTKPFPAVRELAEHSRSLGGDVSRDCAVVVAGSVVEAVRGLRANSVVLLRVAADADADLIRVLTAVLSTRSRNCSLAGTLVIAVDVAGKEGAHSLATSSWEVLGEHMPSVTPTVIADALGAFLRAFCSAFLVVADGDDPQEELAPFESLQLILSRTALQPIHAYSKRKPPRAS